MQIIARRVKFLVLLVWLTAWLPAAGVALADAGTSSGLEYVEDTDVRFRPLVPTARVEAVFNRAFERQRVYVAEQKARKAAAVPQVSRGGVWDRLAQCESTGNWSYNGSSGYDGGLQFLPSTWRAAGGTRYAPYAYLATREQQIAVAESWLAKTSWSQWPACSRKLGLR